MPEQTPRTSQRGTNEPELGWPLPIILRLNCHWILILSKPACLPPNWQLGYLHDCMQRHSDSANRCCDSCGEYALSRMARPINMEGVRFASNGSTFDSWVMWPVAYAENFNGGVIQWHMMVICIWWALFVTSQFDVFMFPNQRFWVSLLT